MAAPLVRREVEVLESIAFVGGGVMAEAIVRRLLAHSLVRPDRVIVGEPVPERRELLAARHGVRTTGRNCEAIRDAGVVVLAVKPQHAGEAFADLRGQFAPEQLALSIIAGVTLARLTGELEHAAVVRVMPNTPAQIGEGMAVWTATPAVSEVDRARARLILQSLGREVFVADEQHLDMATALSGSGPGYVFLFLEAMVDAGVHLGFSRKVAEELVFQTVLGSTLMARESGRHLAELRNLVTSPAGTTAAGLQELEAGRLRATVDRAVIAAFERCRELGAKQPG